MKNLSCRPFASAVAALVLGAVLTTAWPQTGSAAAGDQAELAGEKSEAASASSLSLDDWNPTKLRIKVGDGRNLCLNAVTHYPVIIDRCTDQDYGNWQIRAAKQKDRVMIRNVGMGTCLDSHNKHPYLSPCTETDPGQVWWYDCDKLSNVLAPNSRLTFWNDLSTSMVAGLENLHRKQSWDFVPNPFLRCW
ncbi:ricin-type beta-trefoil lectin domain protein [Nonomuraea lactucae]|uniref:ricin-type beta-trefoil lectin domain protein n=1 Tax=Nonomuraea lactucae TaxID=2249762 RepID=UPI0013B369A4|nr:ricin-type beta-trefoil lectin domain protein [Nonomuraea lactucae]